ncbi:MAG: CRISPR-associated protein [Lachnospiraceae bacterium]|nr:CRISPR-associated protein [Lachnospiraceae bacterium]
MLGECLEIFGSYTEEEREKCILDNYVPKDGTYILVGENGEIKEIAEMKLDKKTGEIDRSSAYFREFRYFDYHSNLISMNKPQDAEKIIHSNNYLSFWVKKESLANGKLTPQVIDGYYDILEHPEKKCEKTKALSIYERLEEAIGPVDVETLQRNKKWIHDHIFSLEEYALNELKYRIDFQKKEYLKIFFEAEEEVYQREGNRYFIPNIYNSNQYNVVINNEVFGLPDNNQGMNAKKPFLSIKTRKSVAPYLLNRENVMLQKQFFDYLMNFAMVGKYNIYVDMEHRAFCACENNQYPQKTVRGFFLRIRKGKEVEIHDQDVVPFFRNHLRKPFVYENKLGIEDVKNPEYEYGKTCETLQELESMIDDIFFSKVLIHNYFSDEEKIKIADETLKRMLLLSRRKLFAWLHLGNDVDIRGLLDKISMELVKTSILNGYMLKAAKQLNLRWSLQQYFAKGGENMADFSVALREDLKTKIISDQYKGLESDREYYFAVGQMARYLVYLSKAGKKKQSLINPFLNARTDRHLKELLGRYFKKYNYAIPVGAKKVSRLYGMLECYEPEDTIMQDMISAGFVIDNLLLEKRDKEEKEDE